MTGLQPVTPMVTTTVASSLTSGHSGTSCQNSGYALVVGTTLRAIGGRTIRMPPLPAVGMVSPILTTSGNLGHGCNMISGKFLSPLTVSMVVCLGWLTWGSLPSVGQGRVPQTSGSRYGPTTPGGYYVQVEPRAVTMAYMQRPQITVAVANATKQPVKNVLVTFTPSE